MKYEDKIARLQRELKERGVKEWKVIPPEFHLYWKFGFQPVPPIFLSLPRYAVIYSPVAFVGTLSGWLLIYGLIRRVSPAEGSVAWMWTGVVIIAISLVVMIYNLHRQKRNLDLGVSNWKDYPGSAGWEGDKTLNQANPSNLGKE
jgi:hypothetical protein